MKKYPLSISAIALAIGMSSYRPSVKYLSFIPNYLDETNVDSPTSYSFYSVVCETGSSTPCRIDLEAITSNVVTDEEEFLLYLAGFPSDATRINEVERLAIGNFKY